jgi:hypothetical protein
MLVSVRTRQDWRPAQHIYLHAPKESIGGHPFTVCNISRPLDQGNNDRNSESTQELLIRVRGGATRQLFKKAMGGDEEMSAGIHKGSKGKRQPVPIDAWSEGPCELLLFCQGALLISQMATRNILEKTTIHSSSSRLGRGYHTAFPTHSILYDVPRQCIRKRETGR